MLGVQAASGRPAALPPTATAGVRYAALGGILCALAFAGLSGAHSIALGLADFEYFYKAGAWLLDHGGMDPRYDILPDGRIQPRGGIEWYLPVVPRLMSVLVWMGRAGKPLGLPPFQTSGAIWLALNLIIVLATLRLLGRYVMGLPPRDWPVTLLVPFLALAVFWTWEFRLNQINNLTMLLMVAAFVHWQSGRRTVAGFWSGLAVLLKLTPALLVLWFALKRQYRTALVAATTVLLAGPVADVIVFRPDGVTDVYRAWMHTALVRTSQTGIILRQREMDWRNQSIAAVATRWLHHTNYATHFDNDPRIIYPTEPKYMNVVSLPREAVAALVAAVTLASLIGLCWLARRPAQHCTVWQLRLEWALFILAMLWFMPVLRRYHFIWMLPAAAVLAGCVHHAGLQRRWARWALAAGGGVVAAQVAMLTRTLFDSHISEAAGVLLLAVVILALPVVAMLLNLARDPDALPADPFLSVHPARAVTRRVRPPGPATPPASATPAHA